MTAPCAITILVSATGVAVRTAGIAHVLEAAGQPRPTATSELTRLSEFVGFIQARPASVDPGAVWKHRISVESVERVKGDLGRGPGTNRFPYIAAGYSFFTGYPTSFGEKGEYLVFLRRESVDGTVMWVTTAALAIEYVPDAAGRIVGMLSGGGQEHPAMSRDEARALLRRIASGDRLGPDEDQLLHQRLGGVALSAESLGSRELATFEQRFEQIKLLADGITVGTRRADVEKVFPQQDGGVSGPTSSRYYAGSEVMVEVPFDQSGGAWRPENRVTGSLRVYRSRMHVD